TLAVAALALLGPLEQSLRNAEKTTLKTDLSHKGALSSFVKASLGDVTTSKTNHDRLLLAQNNLAKRLDARFVDVLRASGGARDIVAPTRDQGDQDDSFNDVATAFRTNKSRFTFGFVDGQEYARAAIPFINKNHHRYVLAVRK